MEPEIGRTEPERERSVTKAVKETRSRKSKWAVVQNAFERMREVMAKGKATGFEIKEHSLPFERENLVQ